MLMGISRRDDTAKSRKGNLTNFSPIGGVIQPPKETNYPPDSAVFSMNYLPIRGENTLSRGMLYVLPVLGAECEHAECKQL